LRSHKKSHFALSAHYVYSKIKLDGGAKRHQEKDLKKRRSTAEAVVSGQMSIREAVVDYGVSKRKIELDTQTREFGSIFCGKKRGPMAMMTATQQKLLET